MSLTAFLRHSLRSVIRNRRRTFSSILGIVLAITMVAGVNIALDSTTGNVLRSLLDQVPYDFSGYGSGSDWKNATYALEGVSRVQDVELVIEATHSEIVVWDENGNYSMAGYGVVTGVMPSFQDHMRDFYLAGPVPTQNGTIVLYEDGYYGPFPDLMPEVGDKVGLLVYDFSNPFNRSIIFYNFTVAGFARFDPGSSSNPFPRDFYNPAFITIEDAMNISRKSIGTSSERYYIWADRDQLVEPFSSEMTRSNIVRMQRILQNAVSVYDVQISSGGLEHAIDSFNMMILGLRVLFLALSLPALVLAIYLGSVGIEMGMDERRREVSIIKARGADTGHITGMFVFEAIISGTLAGVIGLILGVLASRFLLGALVGGFGTPVDLTFFNVSAETVFVTIVLAIIFMGIASLRPIRNISKMQLAEGLHRYSETQAQMRYKPMWDIIMLSLAAITFGLVFYLSSQRGSDPYSYFSLLCIVGPFLVVLIPLSPVFLILSITRLLTRGTTKVYGWMANIVRPIAKDLTNMVKVNLLRNPRRASRICLLVAFGLGFGVLASTMAESELAYTERNLHADIGADIKVESHSTNITFRAELASVSGVAEVVPVFAFTSYTGGYVTVFNSSAYRRAVQVDDYFFTRGAPDSIEMLQDEGYAIISQSFAESAYYDIGDTLRIAAQTIDGPYLNTTYFNVIVVAIVKALPGLQMQPDYYFPGGSSGNVYVDFSSLPGFDFVQMNITSMLPERRFLVDVTGENPTVVAERIEDSYSGTRTAVLEDEIVKARSDPLRGAVFQFLVIEIAFIIMIMSFGLGLVMYTATLEREVELGNIRARGASGRQLSQLMLGEAMSIVTIGAVIGLGTGVLAGLMFNGVLNFPAAFAAPTTVLERPFIFGLQSFMLILIAVVSLTIAALVATYRVRSMDMARVLKKRGG